MSKHNQVEQQLAIYRELSAAERQAVDRHVQNCAACARTQAVYQAMDRALVHLPTPVPDASLRPGFYAALAGAQPPQPLLTLVMGRLPALAAQLVLLVVLLVLGWTVWQGVDEWMAQPAETAVSVTNTPEPTPTATTVPDEPDEEAAVHPIPTPETTDIKPQALSPLFTAPSIQLWPMSWMPPDYLWHPDSHWLGFWLNDQLTFFNPERQEICPFPHDQPERSYELGWHTDGTAVVYGQGQLSGWRGEPCRDEWEAVNDITNFYWPSLFFHPISPDQTYRVEALVTEEGQGNIWINLSLIEQASGLAVNNFTYLHEGSRPNSFPNVWYLRENPGAGRWLDDETFLVNMTLDQGPLLLTTGGEVINLARDLFDVPERIGQQGEFLLWAEAVYQADTDTFDFLLSANFNVNAAPPALLYHGDSGIVEQLPAEASQFVFSANGRWLAIYPQPAMTASSQVRYDRWLRLVKPAGNENYYLLPDEAHRHRHLDANWERLAVVDSAAGRVTIQTFPDETALAVWFTDDYTLHDSAAWSPNGRFLLLSGTHKESGEDGLFLIETGS
jgi:hypothetical protein